MASFCDISAGFIFVYVFFLFIYAVCVEKEQRYGVFLSVNRYISFQVHFYLLF